MKVGQTAGFKYNWLQWKNWSIRRKLGHGKCKVLIFILMWQLCLSSQELTPMHWGVWAKRAVKGTLSLFESASWEQEAIQQINVFVFHIHKPKFKSHLSPKGNKLGDFSVIPSEMYSLHRNTAQHSSSSVQEKPHTETLELLQFRIRRRVFIGRLYNNILYKFINGLRILTSWKGNMENLPRSCLH